MHLISNWSTREYCSTSAQLPRLRLRRDTGDRAKVVIIAKVVMAAINLWTYVVLVTSATYPSLERPVLFLHSTLLLLTISFIS